MGVKHREKAKGVGAGKSAGGRTGRRKQREHGRCGIPNLESRRGRVTLAQPHGAGAPLCPHRGRAVALSRPKHRDLGLPRRKHGRTRRSSPLFPCCKPTKQDTITAHGTCSGNPQRGSKISLVAPPGPPRPLSASVTRTLTSSVAQRARQAVTVSTSPSRRRFRRRRLGACLTICLLSLLHCASQWVYLLLLLGHLTWLVCTHPSLPDTDRYGLLCPAWRIDITMSFSFAVSAVTSVDCGLRSRFLNGCPLS